MRVVMMIDAADSIELDLKYHVLCTNLSFGARVSGNTSKEMHLVHSNTTIHSQPFLPTAY